MDSLSELLNGFSVALQPINLLYVFIGVVIGTAIGVLPGLGPTATIALLLPMTYVLDPTTAIIMLAGIYYGSMYGGTITSVLLRLPGEAASVVTTFDGYQMARKGRAGPALGIAAVGSFIGGTLSTLGLVLLAPSLAKWALAFGPPAMVALIVLGLLLITSLGTGSTWKALSMAALGLFLATIGQDTITGQPRFTFGSPALLDGLNFVAIAMGLFGLGEILYNLEKTGQVQSFVKNIGRVIPTRKDFKDSSGAIARGSVLGFFVGILPGGGGVLSSLASYAMEKKVAKRPEEFGHGAIQGVAGPETANNASSTSSFIPLLILGLPSNVVLAMMFGALLMHGITPGPSLISNHPDLFWGVIASMFVGNLILLALNIPLVGVFIQLLRVRAGVLATLSMVIVMVGVFSISNTTTDVWVVIVFGLLGWLMKKTGFDPAPLVLAFVLGPMLEDNVRQSLLISSGSPMIFVNSAIPLVIYGAIIAGVLWSLIRRFTGRARLLEDTIETVEEVENEGNTFLEPPTAAVNAISLKDARKQARKEQKRLKQRAAQTSGSESESSTLGE